MAKAIYEKAADGKYHCSDTVTIDGKQQPCNAVFSLPTGLGIHRRMVHGVMGTSTASVALRLANERRAKEAAKQERAVKKSTLQDQSQRAVALALADRAIKDKDSKPTKDKLPCLDPNCGMTFSGLRYRSRHVNASHPELSNSSTSLVTTPKGPNGHITSNQTSTQELLTPGVVAELITVGYLQARCETAAIANNIPVRDFTKRVAGYLLAYEGRG